ncbi:hypothetical protein BHE74_00047926, partial [Ensete ventricosum]
TKREREKGGVRERRGTHSFGGVGGMGWGGSSARLAFSDLRSSFSFPPPAGLPQLSEGTADAPPLLASRPTASVG